MTEKSLGSAVQISSDHPLLSGPLNTNQIAAQSVQSFQRYRKVVGMLASAAVSHRRLCKTLSYTVKNRLGPDC